MPELVEQQIKFLPAQQSDKIWAVQLHHIAGLHVSHSTYVLLGLMLPILVSVQIFNIPASQASTNIFFYYFYSVIVVNSTSMAE